MLIRNGGIPLDCFDRKKRISSMISEDDEIQFILKTFNQDQINDNVFIKAEREQNLWIMNEVAYFQDDQIILAPQPQSDPEDIFIKFNSNLRRPCIVEATMSFKESS